MTDPRDEIWRDDLLARRQDADVLEAFLVRRHEERRDAGQTGAYVVNLNAGWGHGKSFFMERLKQQLEASGHLTALVNAWRDDSSREPVIAVMHAIEESLKPHFAVKNGLVKAWNATKAHGATIVASMAKGASRRLAEKYTGHALKEIGELLDEQDGVPSQLEAAFNENSEKAADKAAAEITTLLSNFVDDKISDYRARIASASQFQSRMRALLEQLADKDGVSLPFFVLIDELDRCRPTYAIEMLEQVKHLFDIDNTVFIIATDGDQLAHSVRAVYGAGFDGERYLLRFFHRYYQFAPADRSQLCDYLFALNRIDLTKISTPWDMAPATLFAGAMDRFDVTLRDAEQCFDILRSAVTLWDHKTPILLNVILPMIIFHQRSDPTTLSAFLHGSQTRLPGAGNWSAITDWSDHSGTTRHKISIDQLNRDILDRRDTPLPDVINFQPQNPTGSYVRHVFATEFQSLHGNAFRGKGPKSVINEYAALIRSVGRLAAPAPAPEA